MGQVKKISCKISYFAAVEQVKKIVILLTLGQSENKFTVFEQVKKINSYITDSEQVKS